MSEVERRVRLRPSGRVLPRIKVCGITNQADLEVAVDAGVDAVGFVLAASPRSIEPMVAARLTQSLPPEVLPILVVVDARPGPLEDSVIAARARAVQLCGDQDPFDWKRFPYPILRRIAVAADAEREISRWSSIASGFVLDHPSGAGGTGRSVDVERATALSREAPCLLAGGLSPANVAELVERVQPFGVDASSQLEHEPGRKDAERVRAFVEAARGALEGSPS